VAAAPGAMLLRLSGLAKAWIQLASHIKPGWRLPWSKKWEGYGWLESFEGESCGTLSLENRCFLTPEKRFW
jgi:hypothetical protein